MYLINHRAVWALVVVVALAVVAGAPIAAAGAACAAAAPCALACKSTCPGPERSFMDASSGLSGRSSATAAQGSALPGLSMSALISRVTAVAEAQAAATLSKVNSSVYPVATAIDNGEWVTVPAGHWTSGFWPGVLWQLHSLTGKPIWAQAARTSQQGLSNKQRMWMSQHGAPPGQWSM